jgi:hypothetical protein
MNLNVPVDLHNSFKPVTAGQGTTMTDDEHRHGEERGIRICKFGAGLLMLRAKLENRYPR